MDVLRSNSERGVSSLVAMRAGGEKPPLFLIHGVDGDVARFEGLVKHLDFEQPVWGIKSQALLKSRVAFTRVEELARFYLADMRDRQPQGPYHILGFSFGGLIAFEIARLLHARGEHSGKLGMLDPRPMSPATRPPGAGTPAAAPRRRWVAAHARKVCGPGGMAYAGGKLRARSFRELYTLLDKLRQPIPRFLQRAYDVNWFAAARYVPGHLPAKLTIFQAPGSASHERWSALADEVEVRTVSGSHESILSEPHVELLAREIDQWLAADPNSGVGRSGTF